MRQQQRHLERLRHRSRRLHLMQRRIGEIHRHEDMAHESPRVLNRHRARVVGRRDEHRLRRFAQHALRRRSEEQLANPRHPVRTDDDEVARALPGHPEDFRCGFPDTDVVLHRHRTIWLTIACGPDEVLQLPPAVLRAPDDAASEVERFGQQPVFNGEQQQPRPEVTGNRCRITQGAARSF